MASLIDMSNLISRPIAEPRTSPLAVSSSWPMYEPDEIAAVTEVLRSGRVNALVHGEQNKAFEREFASFIGMPHAIAVANGTVSLEIAFRALGIGTGDEVIIPARSFFATASAVVAVGAEPVFADVEIHSQNIDPASVLRMISERTKAIVCVHLAGRPCDLESLNEICMSNGLLLIEDCAQAHGARYKGRAVGSFGAASSFSFCTDKIMSTGGEGGMVLFKSEAVWANAWAIKDHGKQPPEHRPQGTGLPGEFRYIHQSFGSNFRMTEMQAAIGRAQLRKLPQWIDRRRSNAETLAAEISGLPGLLPDQPDPHGQHAWYKFYALIDETGLPAGLTRSDIIGEMTRVGIQCGSGSCPDMSKEAAFDGRPVRRDGNLPNANSLGARTIMFPVDHLLNEMDMRKISDALKGILQ
ncbi:DegT/DnrJ/EryC1/StrS family aminotransferase [Sphingopyxis sp.]|uniref:DegT/DnrJ/EryC1/StrS family aminotransferase n=1 Tax=Sphingopyxis sp. TaxID=1908224 RepID=UPI003D123CEA